MTKLSTARNIRFNLILMCRRTIVKAKESLLHAMLAWFKILAGNSPTIIREVRLNVGMPFIFVAYPVKLMILVSPCHHIVDDQIRGSTRQESTPESQILHSTIHHRPGELQDDIIIA